MTETVSQDKIYTEVQDDDRTIEMPVKEFYSFKTMNALSHEVRHLRE